MKPSPTRPNGNVPARSFVQHTLLETSHVRTVTRALGPAMAAEVINDPAFADLALGLAGLEKTGRDPVQTLREASERHELESAKSVASVLNHRIKLMTASVDDLADESSPVVTTTDLSPRGRTRSATVVPGP